MGKERHQNLFGLLLPSLQREQNGLQTMEEA